MASEEHLAKLREGTSAWNKWREEQPSVRPDLQGATLTLAQRQWGETNGGPINFAHAVFGPADLRHATLIQSNLEGASLSGADLSGARLRQANLHNAIVSDVCFDDADLADAILSGADLRGADLRGARNLQPYQVASAMGDADTLLPSDFIRPKTWRNGTYVERPEPPSAEPASEPASARAPSAEPASAEPASAKPLSAEPPSAAPASGGTASAAPVSAAPVSVATASAAPASAAAAPAAPAPAKAMLSEATIAQRRSFDPPRLHVPKIHVPIQPAPARKGREAAIPFLVRLDLKQALIVGAGALLLLIGLEYLLAPGAIDVVQRDTSAPVTATEPDQSAAPNLAAAPPPAEAPVVAARPEPAKVVAPPPVAVAPIVAPKPRPAEETPQWMAVSDPPAASTVKDMNGGASVTATSADPVSTSALPGAAKTGAPPAGTSLSVPSTGKLAPVPAGPLAPSELRPEGLAVEPVEAPTAATVRLASVLKAKDIAGAATRPFDLPPASGLAPTSPYGGKPAELGDVRELMPRTDLPKLTALARPGLKREALQAPAAPTSVVEYLSAPKHTTEWVETFIRDFYLSGSALDEADIRRIYSDPVDYFGTHKQSLAEVARAKFSYYEEWPTRHYDLIPGSISVKWRSPTLADVTFEYRFKVAAPDKKTLNGHGRAEVTLDLTGSAGHIVREDGEVLARK